MNTQELVKVLNQKLKNTYIVFLSLVTFSLFVVMDSIAKYLADYCNVSQIIWGRYFFHLIFLFFIISISNKKINYKKNLKFQFLRSLFLILTTIFTYYSVKYNDLINFYIIFFLTPLIVYLMSNFFLKEKISKLSLLLIVLTFCVIVYGLQPSKLNINLNIFLPFLTVLSFACYQLFTKLIAKDSDPFSSIFYTAFLGGIVFSIISFIYWTPINDPMIWLTLVILGLIGFVSHYILSIILSTTNLNFISSFQYSQLIIASVINYYFFQNTIDTEKMIAIILIIIFGIIFIKNEKQRKF